MGTACGSALFLWIQRVVGGGQFSAEVPWLKMIVTCGGSQNWMEGRETGIIVRRYKEGVSLSYAVVWSNISTNMGIIVSRLKWDWCVLML